MTELIIKMVLCLVVALLLGLLIGWLLSKIAQSKKHLFERDVLSNTLDDKNSHIEMLEKKFSEKETTLLQHSHENRELKESLEEKSKSLLNVENQLKNAEESILNNLNFKEENERLSQKVLQLKDIADSKTKEMEELERVLIKAEKTIEEKEKELSSSRKESVGASVMGVGLGSIFSGSDSNNDEDLKSRVEELTLASKEKDNSIALYQETISELENELKLYSVNGEEDEFVISKDQFTHIEEQLVDYQKEIEVLKEDNNRLVQLTNSEKSSDNSVAGDLDDVGIVKLFRETYKKITKS